MNFARKQRWLLLLVAAIVFVEMRTMATPDCPLDLNHSNFTIASSLCSKQETRAKCCRYINAVIAISITRLANVTGNLGVSSDLSDICFGEISKALKRYGVDSNASIFCGFGSKIPLDYECRGRSTVTQMLESPKFSDVGENCRLPLSEDSSCKRCLNAGILYLRDLLGQPMDNVTLSTCRDATFAAIASPFDYASTLQIASCFFGVQDLITEKPDLSPSLIPPSASASSPTAADVPSLSLTTPVKDRSHHSHLKLFLGIGIAITSFSAVMFFVLTVLICKKKRELDDAGDMDDDKASPNSATVSAARKLQDGPTPTFRKFSYKEIKKATGGFGTEIGQGGFGVVYKAVFRDGLTAAVKRMSKVSEQGDDDFCRELELLARLHHRHLVSLRGYCIERRERFLIYEYMENGSLKSHIVHTQGSTPLSWRTRIQIAIDVANALEYLHYYCNPPLCHRDIKSSNILLDENYSAKVADFGLAHASKDGSISFEPVNTDIRGTPGYLDPEYMITQQLTEKSDIYSYGVVLLELITGRKAVQDNKNLVEWSQSYLTSESPVTELVDPYLGEAFDFDQLQTIVGIIRWCTQREGRSRPSIKQVLRLLYESSVPLYSGFVEAMEDCKENGRKSRGKSTALSGGDVRCLASSSSTTRSYCSRSFLLETGMGSPHSPNNIPSP